MTDIAMIDLIGYWLGIFLTFCILSFLYKDNPFYKLAEHIFIGISIGYVVIQQYYNVLRPKLVEGLAAGDLLQLIPLILVLMMFTKAVSKRWSWLGRYPLAFVVALYAGIQINAVAQADLAQQIKRGMVDIEVHKVNINTADATGLATLPGISPSVARKMAEARTGKPSVDTLIALPGVTKDLAKRIVARQIKDERTLARVPGIEPAVAKRIAAAWKPVEFENVGQIQDLPMLGAAERATVADSRGSIQGLDAQAGVKDGERYWFGIFSRLLMLLGLIASLVYFYFSIEHKGAVGKVSRVGIWVLMIGFGASFGYTVQGRISLAIGRAQNVRGDTLAPEIADKVNGPLVALISVVVIVAGIAFWEMRNRNKSDDEGAGA